jgi:hypothetical protein
LAGAAFRVSVVGGMLFTVAVIWMVPLGAEARRMAMAVPL